MLAMKLKPWLRLFRLTLWVKGALVWLVILPGISCVGVPGKTTLGETMTDQSTLIGHWERITNSHCSQAYPTQVEFRENGLYLGTGAQLSIAPGWDQGTYEVTSPTQVRISTAHDAVLTYQFSIVNHTLLFVAPDGCEFQYRKVS